MTEESIETKHTESLIWARALVESAVDGIISIDEIGVIEYVNPSALTMFGYTQEELLGTNVKILIPHPFKETHDEAIHRYIETGEKKIIGIGREVVGMRKDHSTFPMHILVSEVELEGKRRFTALLHDISEQKKAQVEKDHLLQELNWRNMELNCLYRIGELLRGGEIDEEIQYEIVQILNGALSGSEVTGMRLSMEDIVTTSSHFQETPWELSVEIVVEERKRGMLEVFFVHKQDEHSGNSTLNEKRSLLNAIARLLGESLGHREAEVKVLHASKLASIGELAAGVGHEINNPVNSIINCADILIKQMEPDTKLTQFSEHIRSEAERIATIVKDLLTFSKQDTALFSPANMSDIVETVLTLCGKNIEKSHIHLEVDVPSALPKLECRSEQVQQVLMNLVLNAIHALNEKFPEANEDKKLTIKALDRSVDAVPSLHISVSDRGTGISPTHIERIYDPFFTTKGRDTGTGLGLSVSDGIIKNHNGNMSVETQWGEYTKFHIELPLHIQKD